jgi:uncharacterized repeat protein (TIGR02543 family)
VPSSASGPSGAIFTVASGSSLSRAGYVFAGWSDGTTTYKAGTCYTIGSSAITLTAQWTPVSAKPKAHLSFVVYFNTNSAQLASSYTTELMKFAASLKSSGRTSITVVGHSDATGSTRFNQLLSLHRAQSVATALRKQFKVLGLNSVMIRVVGGGVSTTSSTRAKNRRAVTSS